MNVFHNRLLFVSFRTSNEDTESLLRRQSVNETEECEEVTQPQTVDQIRNRYLSRVGQMNVSIANIVDC